ncbi:response regulator [Viridibacterium curvum]|uniref:Response regulatory domain-containing protein n=1 Tax=Viridibacterium curvum TaxID=1101404 RepID=A0ABP9R4A2_9RHOO
MDAKIKIDTPVKEGCILIVDDVPATRALLKGLLQKQFDVVLATSGEDALEQCESAMPDLVLLDMEMPGIGGLETCRVLREMSDIPVIFVTAHDSLDQHILAYDAGGTDVCVKPVSAELLLRKSRLAIVQNRIKHHLDKENSSLQAMAKSYLSSLEDSDLLLDFTRKGIACRSHEALAQLIADTAAGLGVRCAVAIRHNGHETILGAQRPTSELERSMIRQLSTMGRFVQYKSRLAVNYPAITIVACDVPEDSSLAERIRDNLGVLAGTAEAFSENVSMRLESASRAEQMQVALGNAVTTVDNLRVSHRQMVADIRMLLQQLSEDVEHTLSWLAADRSQEKEINDKVYLQIERILRCLLNGTQLDEGFTSVIDSLRGNSGGHDVELF